jgi:hypothetical protein
MTGGRVAFVSIFCIAILVVSGAYADKPEKPGKPGGGTEPEGEFIAFTGDLLGGEVVQGCCPNAGPAPEYSLTLPEGGLGDPNYPPYYSSGTYKGHLFINFFGAGKNQEYLVRFRGTKGLEYLSIEIVGGVIEKDNKNKALTVRFTDEDCRVLVDGCPTPGCGEHIAFVTFTLVRYPV